MKPSLEMIKSFPYPYFQYGSESSTDTDVVIVLSKNEMPLEQEERKQKLKQLMLDFDLDWNATFVVVEDGILIDTVYPKSWVDSLNNAVLKTHSYHKQLFVLPIKKELKRNKTLAIYKTIRTVLTFLTRTHLRTEIKPILKWVHSFDKKVGVIKSIDFSVLDKFNQKNASDEDIWKIIAFYIIQNQLLIERGIEVYSKEEIVYFFPKFKNFIFRNKVSIEEKKVLTEFKNMWMKTVLNHGVFISKANILSCNDEVVDMRKEISL